VDRNRLAALISLLVSLTTTPMSARLIACRQAIGSTDALYRITERGFRRDALLLSRHARCCAAPSAAHRAGLGGDDRAQRQSVSAA